jgi:hypothetical protein
MERNKLLQIKEYSNIISDLIDSTLLIKKNKDIKKISQSFDSSVGPNILEKYNIIPETPEVVPTEEKYKIVETIKKAEKAGNWSLVSKLAGLLLSLSSPPAESLKYQPPSKPIKMEYTSTAGEHNDKYNEQVFNDAEIQNLTINEVLEEPPIKPLLFDADLKAQRNKLKRTNKPLMFDEDLKAQKTKLKPAVVKPLLFDADLKAQKKRLKKTKEDEQAIAKIEEELVPWWDKKKEKKVKKSEATTAQIEEDLIPWWDKKKIKKLNIDEDVKVELLDMIKKLKNTNIQEIDKTKEKEINKKIKKIEKFINNPNVKSEEPKKKKQKINENERTKVNKDNGMAEMIKEIEKEMKEKGVKIKEREKKPKAEKKPKTKKKVSDDDDDSSEDEEYLKNVEHNKRIMMIEQQKLKQSQQENEISDLIKINMKLIDSQAFIDNTQEELKEGADELIKLRKKDKITDSEFMKFLNKYIKVPNLKISEKKKLKLLKEKLNL